MSIIIRSRRDTTLSNVPYYLHFDFGFAAIFRLDPLDTEAVLMSEFNNNMILFFQFF